MAQLRKLHLFNCDRTYKLDAFEGLLVNEMKAKLGFDSVEKHYFSLAQMPEMTHNTIPKLEMDMAFFVVHAHESRLSINEDNAGIGYAKIYRALLEATEGKVIIIIGGDDNYKNKDEEDRVVISRWAKRKISSQFREEFLDGSKSFIFSWNKQHRAIHKEALLHYFDPSKKGQKFEYQLERKEPERDKSAQPSYEGSPVLKCQSLDKRFGRKNSSSAEQGQEESLVVRSRSVDKAGGQSLCSRSNIAEQTRDDDLFGSTTGTPMLSTDSEYGFKSNSFFEPPSSSRTIELAIIGCNVSSDSMQAVKQVFENIRPKLNLVQNPPFKKFAPLEAEQYLMDNRLKYCVLAVDSKTIRDAYDKLSQRIKEYEGLLETAAKNVDNKVIILMCGTCAFKSKKDETAVLQTIEGIINKKGKGFLACLKKDGCLSVDPEVLVQCLMSASPAPRSNPQKDKNGDAPAAAAESYSGQSQTRSECEPGHGCGAQNVLQSVLLRSLLRYGIISEKLEDRQVWTPGFTVPKYISESLLQKHGATKVTGVTIMSDKNGELKCSVNPKLIEISQSRYEGIQIASDETLILKTRIRNGLVSFEESDVHFWNGNWEIPQYIRERLEAEYRSTPCGDLFIISDEKQNLRSIVKIGKVNKMITFVKNVKNKFNA